MDITYQLQGVLFERDENKAKINIQKHNEDYFCPSRDACSEESL